MNISHFVGLSGIGGVQKNFVEYINYQASIDSKLRHKVYTMGAVDYQYKLPIDVYDIRNPLNLLSLIVDIFSRKKIIHFYNNLTSIKVALFLFFIPVRNLVIHERGTVWNCPSSHWPLLRFISWKSDLILANSNATRLMLIQKFSISKNKINVLHNGINTSIECTDIKKNKKSVRVFYIGFIGRLDVPKGVHVLIDAMRHLSGHHIRLIIAGDGPLERRLQMQAESLNNVSFVGRVKESDKFLSQLDLLVVPSIREPLGNVCLEAGLCSVPILAANVDGIPEIIENHISGELINPSQVVEIGNFDNSLLMPEFVINPLSGELQLPMQINPKLLANKIIDLSMNQKLLSMYADNLKTKVISYFNIRRYSLELSGYYEKLLK